VPEEIRRQAERDALYANYISRQQKDIDLLQKDEAQRIPKDFDYAAVEGLSNELKIKLRAARPDSLGQAARIEGMTPAALTLLLARLRRAARLKSA
jgi:tRNA uridine 5-carboxymethylaminomethyl modification enzyme